MTFISKNLIFIHIPKSAGTSIKVALSKTCVEEEHFGVKNHQTFEQLQEKNNEITKKRFSFCVVRNPYERMISMYRFIIRPFKLSKWFEPDNVNELLKKFNSLEKFIKDFEFPNDNWGGFNHRTSQLVWAKGVDKVFKIENKFEIEDFLESKEIRIKIGHKNRWKIYAGQNNYYREFYNDETKKLVKKYFEEDLDKFKYTF